MACVYIRKNCNHRGRSHLGHYVHTRLIVLIQRGVSPAGTTSKWKVSLGEVMRYAMCHPWGDAYIR